MSDSRTHPLRPSHYAVKLLGSEPLSTLLWVSPHICADLSPRIYQGEFQLTAYITWITGTYIPPALLSGNAPFHLSAGWCPQETLRGTHLWAHGAFMPRIHAYPCFCHHFTSENSLSQSCLLYLPFTSLPTTGHGPSGTLKFYPSFQNDDREAQHRGKKVKVLVAQLHPIV